MRPHHTLIGIVGLAVLLAGYVLLPRLEERATMLARDGLYEAALRDVMALPEQHARRPQILMQLHTLHELQGNHAGALEMLEAYLAARPDDLAAREKHAELLARSDRLDAYLVALAGLVTARPRASRISQLLGLYRLHGRHQDELALLQTFAGSRHLDHMEHERLGALLAERGDWLAAEHWLALADQHAPPQAFTGRLLLVDVLVQSGKADEAYRRSLVWMNNWRNPYLTGKLLLVLGQSGGTGTGGAATGGTGEPGPGGAAIELARKGVDLMPDATFDIAGVLTRKGHLVTAQHMLAHWAARKAEPTGKQLRDFVYASLQAGDEQGPILMMRRLVQNGAAAVAQARMAEEMANGYGKAMLAPLRSLLSTPVLRTRPVFAAELAMFEGNVPLARWFLAEADPAALDPEQRHGWLMLLRRVETPSAVFRRLVQLWNERRLPPELLREFADEARLQGQPRLHDAIWVSMQR